MKGQPYITQWNMENDLKKNNSANKDRSIVKLNDKYNKNK